MGNCFSAKTGSPANTGSITTPRDEHDISSSANPKAFTYVELTMATRNFRFDCLIGEGGLGFVYKGWIDEQTLNPVAPKSGMTIAVKKLKPQRCQSREEWRSAVDMLHRLQHPNVVRLIGFCAEGENWLLVYEYMARGSLASNLFTPRVFALTWERRMKIAVGAARGLAFLHGLERPIIFQGFKTTNILLDSEYNAKLSDIGIVKTAPTVASSAVSARIRGTSGYVDPEYATTGHLTTKNDVYSFGVVLFELLTGRRVHDSRIPDNESLLDYVKHYLGDTSRISMIVDKELGNIYPRKAAYLVSMLAAKCTGKFNDRPTMAEVVKALEQLPAQDGPSQSLKRRGSSA